jgi:hypothetical protein
MQDHFTQVDNKVDRVVFQIGANMGVTRDMVKREYDRMMASARSSNADSV